MKQISIQQIDNGFIVGTPPEEPTRLNPNGKPPVMNYCADYNEVVKYLKNVWPLIVSDK